MQKTEVWHARFPLRKFARYGVYCRGTMHCVMAKPGTRKRDVAQALCDVRNAATRVAPYEVRFWGEATA